MTEQRTSQMRIPDDSHPISIERASERVRVRVGNHWVADSVNALELKEASYPAVFYIPLADVDTSVLRTSEHETYCPYKGECSYHHIEAGDRRVMNAIWFYPSPYPSVAQIAGHVAFYTDRVDEFSVG